MPPDLLALAAQLGVDTPSLLGRTVGVLATAAVFIILGFGAVTFARPALEAISDTVVHSFARAFAVGLLAQILAFPTVGLFALGLALTVVGIALIPFVVAVSALVILTFAVLGLLSAAHAMGATWTRRRLTLGSAAAPNSYRYVSAGLLGLVALWMLWGLAGGLPVAGAVTLVGALLVTWLALTAGSGAALLSRLGMRQEFAGRRLLPPDWLTDEYLWPTPRYGANQAEGQGPRAEEP